MKRAVLAGSAVCALAGLAMAGLAWSGIATISAVMAPMVFYMIGMGIVLPQGTAAAIGSYPHMAGIASSVVGFMQYALASVIGIGVGQLHDGTQTPMTTSIGAMGVATLAVFLLMAGREREPADT
jgi:DHA1 family bicyclomycin/chloramphenicol resistance-like MFS transporter